LATITILGAPLLMTARLTSRPHAVNRDHDRRLHRRVAVVLLGRFMLEDRHEFPCQTQDISPGGIALTTPVVARVAERVVAYLDHVGRIEGHVARPYEGGFAMTIVATPRKRDTLAAKLTWLANRHELKLPEDRRHERVVPKTNLMPTIFLPDGREYPGKVIDMSLSGAAIAVTVKPPIGSPVTIGKLRAIVVRHFEQGFAVEFTTLQTMPTLEQNLT
jgi:hypothetical protein